MQEHRIFVYLIPGGEQDSQNAYQQLVALCRTNPELLLTVYRGTNPHNGQWSLVLIGTQDTFEHYQQQIQAPLIAARAQPITVPVESLRPLLEHFLQTQAEMLVLRTPFLERHHPVPPRRAGKKKSSRKRRR